jgi:hypothetical protein
MVRAMAALLAVMPADDADRPALVECLRAALKARNPDFPARGVGNVDSALEALLLVSALGEPMQREPAGAATPEALAVLERHIAAGIRAGKGPASPAVFGRYLEYLSRR